jgi:hypothetical protein
MKTPLEEMFPSEPRLTRQYESDEYGTYARIRIAGDGLELWRYRCSDPYSLNPRQLDADADSFETMEDFIEWVHLARLEKVNGELENEPT